MVIGDNDFRRGLGRTLAGPEFSGQFAFLDTAKREQERHVGRQDVRRTLSDTPQSFVASLKEIGRNDTCPCGSGYNFKQ
jgi:uncharacterized protein YecA (UPF0149 family)